MINNKQKAKSNKWEWRSNIFKEFNTEKKKNLKSTISIK